MGPNNVGAFPADCHLQRPSSGQKGLFLSCPVSRAGPEPPHPNPRCVMRKPPLETATSCKFHQASELKTWIIDESGLEKEYLN